MMISKKNLSLLTLLMILAVSSAGCEVVGGIFKAGMWVGVIMVALILVVVFWIMGKMRRRRASAGPCSAVRGSRARARLAAPCPGAAKTSPIRVAPSDRARMGR